jgi:murein DD-endopeptidase MepM/ murein hydrolase activator NlpD
MDRLRLFAPARNGIREIDDFGSGRFGASRGNRLHKGIDYKVTLGERVRSPCNGVVRRIGRCYGDTPEYKLVEIDTAGAVVRVLYVSPEVHPGDTVVIGDTIGYAQDISKRYGRGMDNHVHLEVRLTNGVLVGKGRTPPEHVWVDPQLFIRGL